MPELRPCCECCGKALPADQAGANICTFECTFCDECAGKLSRVCPNCGGNLVARAVHPAGALERHPASTVRIVKPAGCFPG
ncbi:DUF1272 domain-containing protein [Deinococcus aluminii]|uniref:DUF1272 domain-containing protein n=1 Tax=Deinococcus aluminii TaxID=1656885 RepID=A0ABP9XDA9_9DEIO